MVAREIAHKVDYAWAINTKKDFCRVGDKVIPFDIVCDLTRAVTCSPDVLANGNNTLTITNKLVGVVGNAGEGIESGVAQLAGEVILTSGSSTVFCNGMATVRDGDACEMNCSAAGKSNVPGKIYITRIEAIVARMRENAGLLAPSPASLYWPIAEEGVRAAADVVKGWKDLLKTAWQATGLTGSDAETAAARGQLRAGLQFISDLVPPSNMDLIMAIASPEGRLLLADRLARNEAAYKQVLGGLQQAWNESYDRNGLLGALSYMATSGVLEAVVGTKGVGAVGKLAIRGIGMVSARVMATAGRLVNGPGTLMDKIALLDRMYATELAAGASAEDLALISKLREDLAAQARATGPGDGLAVFRPRRLRTQQEMLGKSEGGPGEWTAVQERPKGAEYQEQVSGVERGTEYRVNGVDFDAYDAERRVLIDAKDWERYPPLDARFWHDGTLREARGQLMATAGTGVPIEWHFSTPEGLDAVQRLFYRNGVDGIRLVVVPKGP